MSDGEDDGDDQSPKGEKQRQRSRSRERVCPRVQVPQEPQIHLMATPESDEKISDEDLTLVDPSSPSAGPPSSAELRNRSRTAERSSSRERVHPRSFSHASHQQEEPVVPPPPGIQQNQAAQSEDEKSRTMGSQNHVSSHSKSPQDHEDTRRQGRQTPKGKKIMQKSSKVHHQRPSSTSL